MVTTKRLHLHYASLDRYHAGRLEDVRVALNRGADIVGFDEAPGILGDIREIARNNGYTATTWTANSEEALCVKDEFRIVTRGRVKASNHVAASPNRYISWVGVSWNGVQLMPHIAHWIVHVADHSAHIMTNANRVRENKKITMAMIRQMHLHGGAGHLAVMMGDTNIDEQADNRVNNQQLINYNFRQGDLVTIWDEMRVYPNTHANTTYDMVGTYDPRGIAKAVSWKVYPKQNSDHRPVSGWYDIDVTPGKATGGGKTGGTSTGGGNLPGTQDYSWWDFSDYSDDTVYELVAAVDDPDE